MHARSRHAFGWLHQLQRQYLFRQPGAQRSNGAVRHVGTVGGGVVGGVLGNMVGGGRGKTLATIAGAALGAAGGYAGEKALTKQNGLEITVELENGQQLSIVQAADQQFSPGERVRVLRGSDGSARVTR